MTVALGMLQCTSSLQLKRPTQHCRASLEIHAMSSGVHTQRIRNMMGEFSGVGLAVMGDVTYRHVFGGNDTTGEVTGRQPPAMDVTDDSLYGQVHSHAQEEALNAPDPQPRESIAEAKCALCTPCEMQIVLHGIFFSVGNLRSGALDALAVEALETDTPLRCSDTDQKEDMVPAAMSIPVFEDAWEEHSLQVQSPVGPTEAVQEEETDEAPLASAGAHACCPPAHLAAPAIKDMLVQCVAITLAALKKLRYARQHICNNIFYKFDRRFFCVSLLFVLS